LPFFINGTHIKFSQWLRMGERKAQPGIAGQKVTGHLTSRWPYLSSKDGEAVEDPAVHLEMCNT